MADRMPSRTVKMRPGDDVYSFFMFMMPVEYYKSGNLTWNKILATLLVFVALFLQFVMLYAIYNVVVQGDTDWRGSIVNMDLKPGQCRSAGSLCFKTKDGDFSCAPPSVQLTSRWDELDTDGDGIWTKQEVLAAKKDLQCKYIVDPVEVFNVFAKFLIMREKVIWLHPDVKNFKAIHRPYFDYAKGDVIMCGYRNQDMCPNLLKRGIFDEPLANNNAPRVGNTIESALKYCYDLLEDGGICERTLPSTYAVWRRNSADQCGGADYSKFVYEHPNGGMTKSMLAVDYGARKAYQRAEGSSLFWTYKACIIVIYLMAMFMELKLIALKVSWVLLFPKASKFGGQCVVEMPNKDDPEKMTYVVQATSGGFRFVVGFLTLLRILMVVVSSHIGLTFLSGCTSYLDLLLNGLGLIFIVEITSLCNAQMLDEDLQEDLESMEPMEVPVSSCWSQKPGLRNLLWFFCLLVVMAVWFMSYQYAVVEPMRQALECTCLSQGETCVEADRFSNAFWDDYWSKQVPAVFADVKNIQGDYNKSLAQFIAQQNEVDEAQASDTAAETMFFRHQRPSYRERPQEVHYHRRHRSRRLLNR